MSIQVCNRPFHWRKTVGDIFWETELYTVSIKGRYKTCVKRPYMEYCEQNPTDPTDSTPDRDNHRHKYSYRII